ncbi:hypothetical protein C8Q77DRAFT_677417 [Trametes polyzona]|nr:hypothetical protein C8Q77DRAFT_677417 [Trametes polyzona]
MTETSKYSAAHTRRARFRKSRGSVSWFCSSLDRRDNGTYAYRAPIASPAIKTFIELEPLSRLSHKRRHCFSAAGTRAVSPTRSPHTSEHGRRLQSRCRVYALNLRVIWTMPAMLPFARRACDPDDDDADTSLMRRRPSEDSTCVQCAMPTYRPARSDRFVRSMRLRVRHRADDHPEKARRTDVLPGPGASRARTACVLVAYGLAGPRRGSLWRTVAASCAARVGHAELLTVLGDPLAPMRER